MKRKRQTRNLSELGSSISIVPVRAFLQVPCEFLAMYVLVYQVYFSVSIELIQFQFAHDEVIKTLETKRLWWQCLILCAFCYCDKSCQAAWLSSMSRMSIASCLIERLVPRQEHGLDVAPFDNERRCVVNRLSLLLLCKSCPGNKGRGSGGGV